MFTAQELCWGESSIRMRRFRFKKAQDDRGWA